MRGIVDFLLLSGVGLGTCGEGRIADAGRQGFALALGFVGETLLRRLFSEQIIARVVADGAYRRVDRQPEQTGDDHKREQLPDARRPCFSEAAG